MVIYLNVTLQVCIFIQELFWMGKNLGEKQASPN